MKAANCPVWHDRSDVCFIIHLTVFCRSDLRKLSNVKYPIYHHRFPKAVVLIPEGILLEKFFTMEIAMIDENFCRQTYSLCFVKVLLVF